VLNHLYSSAAQFIPLTKENTEPSMNPQAEFNPASSLNDWLLNHFGIGQNQEPKDKMSDNSKLEEF
jgi:hypothetical protein